MNLWRVEQVEPARAVLDFSSSGQGHRTVTQLVADGEILANAIEFTTWSAGSTQVEVCSECGVERCASGGWVAPRRSGEHLVWLPAFDELAEDDAEFGPPRYFAERGLPVFEPPAAGRVAATVGVAFQELRALSYREVALLLQWTAPGRLLGLPPAPPRVRREDVLAISSGDREEILGRLDELLAVALRSDAEVVLQSLSDATEPVGFFLDLPGHPEWTPLARFYDRLELRVAGLVVRPTT